MTDEPYLVSDSYKPPSARMITLCLLAGVLVVAAITVVLMATTGGATEQDGSCPQALERVIEAAPEEASRLQLLVDIPSDAPSSARRISADLVPVLERSLAEGAFVSLVRDPGDGKPLGVSSCFDGTRFFRVDFDNDTRQSKEMAKIMTTASDHLEQFLTEAEVSTTGSPLRLLQRASSETAHGGADSAQVVVWSDFLSNAADCLNPDGNPATTETITAIRQRCSAIGSLRPIGGDVTLLGVGRTPRAEGFELWARDLAFALCQEVTPTCEIGS